MPDPSPDALDQRLDAIARHPFRAKFHLRGRDRATAELSGPATIRRHAGELIAKRLAPAEPYKDGKQTPYRGHPVFVAQHATATCCRTCLLRWHQIPRGRELTPEERAYVVNVIFRWIQREMTNSPRRPARTGPAGAETYTSPPLTADVTARSPLPAAC